MATPLILVTLLNKEFPIDLKAGQVLHLKLARVENPHSAIWNVDAEDVTPEPGAEIGYCCSVCGIVGPAEPDGSLPKEWSRRKLEDGRVVFVCDKDCLENVPFCRVCGCTERNACMTALGTCHWVEKDLCSACAGKRAFEEFPEKYLEAVTKGLGAPISELATEFAPLPESEMEGLYHLGSSICAMAICAPDDMPREKIEEICNRHSPTGISSRWKISDEPEAKPNPRPCPSSKMRQHWGLTC